MSVEGVLARALSIGKSCGVGLAFDVPNELVKIEGYLVDMLDFIAIAERNSSKDPKLMRLLEELKDAAYDAEDLLDEYAIEAARRRSEGGQNITSVRDTFTNKVRKVIASLFSQVADRPRFYSKRLQELSERLEAINAEFKHMKIEFRRCGEPHPLVAESQVFGRDEEKENILSSLLSTQAGDGGEHDHISVISIVGMGGVGKTTLANFAFNDERVQTHFELKMWIYVSDDDFDIISLGNRIIERATGDNPDLRDVEHLSILVRKKLSRKRFLMVLDDVWNEEPDKWYRLRDLLICGGRGSKIVVTTRSLNVAYMMSTIKPLILEGLLEADCLSLFTQRAFGNQERREAYQNLVMIGKEIGKKCVGNPLAVAAIGGLLRCERSEHKWASVRDAEMRNIDYETGCVIFSTLRLSYDHLNPHLKQCFAFCAIFPCDYEIEKEDLIKLWMANGFIPSYRGIELEDAANDIFDELAMRSFFQEVVTSDDVTPSLFLEVVTSDDVTPSVFPEVVTSDDVTPSLFPEVVTSDDVTPSLFPNRKRTTLRIHRLMHYLAQLLMDNEICVVQKEDKCPIVSEKARHFFTDRTKPSETLVASLSRAQKLRTYIMLQNAFQFPLDVGRLFRFLRVLDLQGQGRGVEKQLLASLGNLQHLRYLNLSYSSIDILPESLTNLYCLQTLILRCCKNLCELPKQLGNLFNLRYLDISGCHELTHMPAKMGQLICLQELNRFIVGRADYIACSGVGELKGLNLRGLLSIEQLENMTDVFDVPRGVLINKPNLTSLCLNWAHDPSHSSILAFTEGDGTGREIAVLQKMVLDCLQPHKNLQMLTISNYGGINFPHWMMDTTFTRLVDIILYQCWQCRRLPSLGQLPFLKVLKISNLNNVEQIDCEFYGNGMQEGFPSLEILEIFKMDKLKFWSGTIWKGERVFASLVKLKISRCPWLTKVKLFPYFEDLNSKSPQGSIENPLCQDVMQNLTNLKSLEISDCNQLEYFDMGLHNLTSLKSMDLKRCNLLSFEDGDDIRCLSSLEKLSIDSCDRLISSGKGGLHYPNSLRSLAITNSDEFARVENELSSLTNLQSLTLNRCRGLKSLSAGIKELTSLEILSIINCPEMASLPVELKCLTTLQVIIKGCPALQKLVLEKEEGQGR